MQLTEEIWIGVRCTGKKTVLAGGVLACLLSLSACGADDTVVSYEKETYNTDLYRAELFAGRSVRNPLRMYLSTDFQGTVRCTGQVFST